jgi:hypothetical protein
MITPKNRHGIILSFPIGKIDFATNGCQAVGMTDHDATRRFYIDQLRIAAMLRH